MWPFYLSDIQANTAERGSAIPSKLTKIVSPELVYILCKLLVPFAFQGTVLPKILRENGYGKSSG